MKKIFSIFLCAAFVFALSASLFAEQRWIKNDEFKTDSAIDFRPSNEVSLYYEAGVYDSADNATYYQEYTVGTKHASGDTVYGSSSGDSNIYKYTREDYKGKDGATIGFGIFPTAGESDWGTGWEKI